MSTPPVNSPFTSSNTVGRVEQKVKRKLMETSPDNTAMVGNLSTAELMSMMQQSMSQLLDKKLENLPTKTDILDIKCSMEGVKEDIKRLTTENEVLKTEIKALREAKEEDSKRLQKLENQLGRTKLIIRGLPNQKGLYGAVNNLFRNNLKMNFEPEIENIKKMHETNDKMTVLVELKSARTVSEVFKCTKLLAGSSIFIERDLSGVRLQKKKVMLLMKKELQKLNRDKRIGVRGEQLVVEGRTFYWNAENRLMCGQSCGIEELTNMFGDGMKSLNMNYNHLVGNLSSKNY
uniref:Uncharacterized protein n=1 Tax=Stomoxys calcitrans TaxID=35570 RepID=A0A1I8PKZ3_STOCA